MILTEIKKKTLPLDEYINFCLYKFKNSYYQKKRKFGYGGDFVTSPHISSIFSEMISVWLLTFWDQINKPKIINILELGPGDGTMSNDILNSLSKFSFFKSKINYFLLETSNSLKKEQKIKLKGKKNIFWIKKLKNFKKKNLAIISNEFFDALPVKQLIKKENTWLEKNIFFNKSANKLDYIFKKPKNSLMKQIKNIYNLDINTFIEFSPKLENIIKDISKILMSKNSIFLTIDYGDYSEICNDTVQAIYNNKKAILLENIGDSDITYQINFFHLIKLFKNYKLNIVDFTSQSKFLQRLGIKERFEHSAKNLNPMERKKLSNSIARLLHPSQMGDLFKVLIVSKMNKKNQNLQYDI
jgi:cyclopropane-fatty-acyl-phospholipid synthase